MASMLPAMPAAATRRDIPLVPALVTDKRWEQSGVRNLLRLDGELARGQFKTGCVFGTATVAIPLSATRAAAERRGEQKG